MSNIVAMNTPRTALVPIDKTTQVVLRGPTSIGLEQQPASNTPGSGGFTSISITGLEEAIVDRVFLLRCRFRVQLGVTPGKYGEWEALRQWCLNSVMNEITGSINGKPGISLSRPDDHVHALMCYNNSTFQRNSKWSMSPSMPDVFQQYSDAANVGTDPWIGGLAMNALAGYGNNGAETARGGFYPDVIDNAAGLYEFTIEEPIMFSPYLTGVVEDEGLANLKSLKFNISWTDFERVWSVNANTQAGQTVTVTMLEPPIIKYTALNIPDYNERVPNELVYSWSGTGPFDVGVTNVPPGGTAQTTLQCNLDSCPKAIYLFAVRTNKSIFTTDTFGVIERCKVKVGTAKSTTIFEDVNDLFRVSSKNGFNLSYPAFARHKGSVIKFNLGEDVPIPDGTSPGAPMLGVSRITFNEVVIRNTSANTQDYTLRALAVYDGYLKTMNIGGGMSAEMNNSRLTYDDVIAARSLEAIDLTTYKTLHGGGFWSGLKGLVNTVAKGVGAVAPVVGSIIPGLAPAAGIASTVANLAQNATGGNVFGGAEPPKPKKKSKPKKKKMGVQSRR